MQENLMDDQFGIPKRVGTELCLQPTKYGEVDS